MSAKQGGQSIGKFQQVATKIVDMKLRVESARHMLYHGAWLRPVIASRFTWRPRWPSCTSAIAG